MRFIELYSISNSYFEMFRIVKMEIFYLHIRNNICNFAAKFRKFVQTMKRIVFLILLVFLSAGSIGTFAANKKAKTFTKKYHNEKLIVVLHDLCTRNGYTLNILDEIDGNKRITEQFKNASTGTVLRKVLDKDFQGKVKKGVLTITRKPSPPVTYTRMATEPSEIIDNDSVTRKIYQDTVYTVHCAMKTFEEIQSVVPKEPKRKKQEDTTGVNRLEHNLQVMIGAGYSTMGYSLGQDGKEIGWVGLNAQLRYLYYFTPNWGIGAGIGFSNYGSTGTLNATTVFTPNISDSDVPLSGTKGEDYEHHVKTHDWREQQRAYMVDVPVLVQCTYPITAPKKNGPVKLYADCGVDLGMTVVANRKLTGGSIDHVGWYKPWKLELTDIAGHDFYSEQAADFETGKQALKLRMPAVGLTADLGLAIPLLEHVDLLLGVYANYVVNNVCSATQDIGWKNTDATGYKTHDFMNEYAGIIGTQYASSVHPWQAGIRVGINFHSHSPEKKKEAEVNIIYTRVNVCDTTSVLQPREEIITKAVTVQKIKRVLAKSVIWFDINSAEPKLKPADILIQVADILKENPFQKILVTGHASRDGDKEKNQHLSEARAKAIVNLLLELGVKPEQIESRAEGVDRDYIQGNHDISLDRRVEITPIE